MLGPSMKALAETDIVLELEDLWNKYFDVVPAVTTQLLDQVFALRYQVYCVEHQFEDPAKYPTHREHDVFDAVSQHIALSYRISGEVVGTCRLIFPSDAAPTALPIMSLLGADARAELQAYPIDEMAEISRYIVSKALRRRRGEDEFPDVGYSPFDVESARRLMPHLTLGLIQGLLQLVSSGQVRYFCASMRPSLLRLLGQLGLKFKTVGPLVNHHGLRQPCIAAVSDLLLGLKRWAVDSKIKKQTA